MSNLSRGVPLHLYPDPICPVDSLDIAPRGNIRCPFQMDIQRTGKNASNLWQVRNGERGTWAIYASNDYGSHIAISYASESEPCPVSSAVLRCLIDGSSGGKFGTVSVHLATVLRIRGVKS